MLKIDQVVRLPQPHQQGFPHYLLHVNLRHSAYISGITCCVGQPLLALVDSLPLRELQLLKPLLLLITSPDLL